MAIPIDVRNAFSLKTSFLYEMLRQGRIRTSLIPGRGRTGRGKRLFNFGSIRQLLAELEDSGENRCPPPPPIPRAEIPVKSRAKKKKT